MAADQEVVNRWSVSAPFWAKHREVIRQMFAPVTQALVEDARIGGQRAVLDVATGPGEPALSIAALLGEEGTVIGIDPIPEMVSAAGRAANTVRNAHFAMGFADSLPFRDAAFDAVVSRFGVMFFPSPVAGLREMFRVLKPGGRVALAVWDFAENNPFHYIGSRALQAFADSTPAAPDAADAFRFAHPGKLRDALQEANAKAPRERLLQFKIEAPLSAENFWKLRCEMSDSIREKVARLSTDQLSEVSRVAIGALSEYSTGRGMSIPAQVLIVSGERG